MTSAEVIPLDPELREVLENLAGGLFPLDAWIKSKTYTPAEADLPWRKGTEPLSPKKIGVIQFFEALVRETAGDAHLIARWHQLIAEPLVFSPLAGMHEWRTRRGLEPEPEFGALESENVLTDFEGKPISRANFYAAYFPLLKQAVKAAAAQGPIQWEVFADNLFKDEKDVPAPVWPKGQPRRPSNFIKQFSRDLLYAMMGMRNAAPEPLKTALLTELGEHRRVGNDYKPEDTKNAVQEFKKVLQKVTQQPLPPTTPVPPSAPPLGSPRIGPPPVGSPSVVSTSPQPVAPLARQRK
ncbi:MAG TPA: hypothetical protein VGK77_18640 [Candidatus Binatia bacterium]